MKTQVKDRVVTDLGQAHNLIQVANLRQAAAVQAAVADLLDLLVVALEVLVLKINQRHLKVEMQELL